ncbi:Inositol-1-monophosphatase SuhB [Corynebacterium occultum]|uniref:Inositol-1-monophosphatase n=1 Tax=Corynebacterium occultum TaxID=2675219 RepID=A0A6B8WML9_9CORY|nr:inositol monophosphatase family protein [Corynebacterium occultum]QGU07578.1 Inositol-1-monophosphatase SuhB [Corynebacterium occultum]
MTETLSARPEWAGNDPAILREIAVETAELAAGRIVAKREELGDIRKFVTIKSSAVDPVTVVDTMAEDFIADRLEQLRPEDGIIGEEGSSRESISGVSWVIDPIDGTVNFLYGLPQYAVSIGAAINGEVVAGAVVNVPTGVVYSAARGEGASRRSGAEEIRLRVNTVTDPAQVLLATGFSYSSTRRAAQAELLTHILPEVRDIRRLGSAALDFCALAEGSVDAFYEHGLNCWDYAAGAVIAAEAGAVVKIPNLSTPGEVGELTFAAADKVAQSLGEIFERCGAQGPLTR